MVKMIKVAVGAVALLAASGCLRPVGMVVQDIKLVGPSTLVIERCKLTQQAWTNGVFLLNNECTSQRLDVGAGKVEPSTTAAPPR
jgi:hypothetical protein